MREHGSRCRYDASMRRSSVLAAVFVVALGAIALAGCGGDEESAGTTDTVTETHGDDTETHEGTDLEGDPVAGKTVFTANCASCHTLADAGTIGSVGPNLDDSKPSFEHVVDRVTHGEGVMPSFEDTLSEQQIADVAAYVSQTAGG